MAIAFALCLSCSAYWWTGGIDKVVAANSSGRDKAEALVAAYAKHVGAHDAVHQTLDADNDRSFGDFGFHYFPEKDVLQARVFIAAARLKDSNSQEIAALRRCIAGYNDPKIGGMYDKGGGFFFIDEKKDAEFLAKDYPLQMVNVTAFTQDVDNLRSLAGIWLMSWGPHAADQVFGQEPLPTHFVSRNNDPYKR